MDQSKRLTRPGEQVAVLAVSLDEFPRAVPRPVCVKIDVEGHEAEVLAGASLLRNNWCVVQVRL
jgi:FkbM family methyltransferase